MQTAPGFHSLYIATAGTPLAVLNRRGGSRETDCIDPAPPVGIRAETERCVGEPNRLPRRGAAAARRTLISAQPSG
jgi:hypothetical protein